MPPPSSWSPSYERDDLSRCDTTRTLLEEQHVAVEARADDVTVRAGLHLHGPASRWGCTRPRHVVELDAVGEQRVVGADRDPRRRGVDVDDVLRLADGDAEPASLPDREALDPVVACRRHAPAPSTTAPARVVDARAARRPGGPPGGRSTRPCSRASSPSAARALRPGRARRPWSASPTGSSVRASSRWPSM